MQIVVGSRFVLILVGFIGVGSIVVGSDWLFLDYELFEAITVLALIESINVGSESLFVDPELLVLYPNLYSLDPNLLSLDQESGRQYQTLIQQ